ncbi:MAG: hypothetical protein IKB64_06990, partial [Paludibacteraceae bacterium]|nr:hypothetical protein [Paludibacteraceae bacterium]
FVEIYECTEKEKEAYLNKIDWDGMTVGVVGTISQYANVNNKKNSYIQCRIVRYPTSATSCSNHELNELNNELMRGVYI